MRIPSRLSEALLVALLAGAALWTFSSASREVRFQGDESNYMSRGRYFVSLFVERSGDLPFQRDAYDVHTQPMLANYLVGATLWLAGYDLQRVKGYKWGQTRAENARQGRVPDAATLALIRTPMVGLATGVVLLLYALGRSLSGPLAGTVAALVGLASPLAQLALVRARNDAPLAFFLLLGLLLGVLGARRGRQGSLPATWAVATGVALGLALAAKLTALLGLAAMLGWGGLAALAGWSEGGEGLGARLRAAWAAGRGWLLAVLVGVGVFVAANPHLWRDPVRHTAHMLEHRSAQMRSHQRNYPSSAVPNLLDRPGRVLLGSTVAGTWGGSQRVPGEAVAAAVGGLALLASAWSTWRRRVVPSAEGLVLAMVLAYLAGVSAGLYVAFNLYFFPTLLLGAVLSGLGVNTLLRFLTGAVLRGRPASAAAPGGSALAGGPRGGSLA